MLPKLTRDRATSSRGALIGRGDADAIPITGRRCHRSSPSIKLKYSQQVKMTVPSTLICIIEMRVVEFLLLFRDEGKLR